MINDLYYCYSVHKNLFGMDIFIKMSYIPIDPYTNFLDKYRTYPEIVLNDQCLKSFHKHCYITLIVLI